MPTILSHPVVPLSMALMAGRKEVPGRLLAAGIAGSILPDLDVIGLKLGVPYADVFGHRGFFHSLICALTVATLGALYHRKLKAKFGMALVFLFASVASHGLLDAATDGGLGVALLSPFSNHRYFFSWHPIAVSPLSMARILTERFRLVFISELKWVWFPFLSIGTTGYLMRRTRGCSRGD
jgi:inner membrane protein